MKVSNVIEVRAEAIASSMAGKIRAPLTKVSMRLPASTVGPNSTDSARPNAGSDDG